MKLEFPAALGAGVEGGYFAGFIGDVGGLFALIVAPKSDGEHAQAVWNKSVKAVDGAGSFHDGRANTDAMAAGGSKLAQWARALRIDGHDDWYLPARDELELLYRQFKPTDYSNYVYRSGDNPSSVPPGYPYNDNSPKRSEHAGFAEGGDQAFAATWYWSSTQFAGDSDYAWYQGFGGGHQGYDRKASKLRARAVRRVPV